MVSARWIVRTLSISRLPGFPRLRADVAALFHIDDVERSRWQSRRGTLWAAFRAALEPEFRASGAENETGRPVVGGGQEQPVVEESRIILRPADAVLCRSAA